MLKSFKQCSSALLLQMFIPSTWQYYIAQTRFQSSVFQGILQKMANGWENLGVIHVHRSKKWISHVRIILRINHWAFHLFPCNHLLHACLDSFDCDCHLAWLIVDNRHLLRHVRGAKCSDGLPFTKLTSSQFAACNGTSGQLKPHPLSWYNGRQAIDSHITCSQPATLRTKCND